METIYIRAREIAGILSDYFHDVWNRPHSAEIMGAIAALIVLLAAVRAIKRRYAPVRLFNNSAGVVTVTPKALDELVQSVCYSMGALNRPDVKISAKRGRLSLLVSLKLEMGQKLSDVSASLQDELSNALREHLGVEKLGSIDVRIKGFKGVLRKPAPVFRPLEEAEKADAEPETNDPFSTRP